MRLNSSEDSADSNSPLVRPCGPLSWPTRICSRNFVSPVPIVPTAYDEKKIVFSPLKSDFWWMDRTFRDGRKAIENGARLLQFGLTEAGEQHNQGLKEAAGKFGEKHKQGMETFGEKSKEGMKKAAETFGERHKQGMNKAAGKVGGKFASGLISGASVLGFSAFLVASKNLDGTIFTIDVLCVFVLVTCNLFVFNHLLT